MLHTYNAEQGEADVLPHSDRNYLFVQGLQLWAGAIKNAVYLQMNSEGKKQQNISVPVLQGSFSGDFESSLHISH